MSDVGQKPSVQRISFDELTESLARQILNLESAVWSSEAEQQDASADECAEYLRGDGARLHRTLFLVQEEDGMIAHAELFRRVIKAEDRALEVACLAGVCVLPARQGEGWGKAVTQAAFAAVDAGEFAVALFQTPVPAFYARLGARKIDNVWVNRRSEQPRAYPWNDKFVMIYPASYPWPAGTIDLNGPAF